MEIARFVITSCVSRRSLKCYRLHLVLYHFFNYKTKIWKKYFEVWVSFFLIFMLKFDFSQANDEWSSDERWTSGFKDQHNVQSPGGFGSNRGVSSTEGQCLNGKNKTLGEQKKTKKSNSTCLCTCLNLCCWASLLSLLDTWPKPKSKVAGANFICNCQICIPKKMFAKNSSAYFRT